MTLAFGKKPKKLDENNVAYLVALETQLAVNEGSLAEDEDEQERRETLVDNVLAELSQCTASAACDRRTNVLLEKLCYLANLTQLVELLQRFAPYSVFLARQRHASHVLQALLARLCYLLKHNGIPTTDPEKLNEDILQGAVLGLASPVLREVSWLCKELSASHVIRSLMCCLAGMPVVSERKGKGSKHQHSVSLSEALENLIEPKLFYISRNVLFYVPSEFREALGSAVASLLTSSPAEMQDLVADTCSCAVLSLAVRILSTPDLVEGGEGLAEQLIRRTLHWADSDEEKQDESGNDDEDSTKVEPKSGAGATIFYGMAADKSASHFLETALECAPAVGDGGGLLGGLIRQSIVSRAKEYANDSLGNFVLQAALRRLSAEIERQQQDSASGGGRGSAKKQRGSGGRKLVAIADALLRELCAPLVFRDLATRKGGVCLWLLELARWGPSPLPSSSSSLSSSSSSSSSSSASASWADQCGSVMVEHWRSSPSSAVPRSLEETLASKLAPVAKPAAPAAAAGSKESSKPSSLGAGRGKFDKTAEESAQLLLARQVGAVLLLPLGCPARQATLAAVGKLPGAVLLHVATHGPMSRALLDPFFAAFATGGKHKNASQPLATLVRTMEPHVPEIGVHYVGQHLVKLAFEKSDAEGKEVLARAVHRAKDKLVGSKEGRNTIKVVHADLYGRDKKDWEQLVHRQIKGQEMLVGLAAPPASARPSKPQAKEQKQEIQQEEAEAEGEGDGPEGGGAKRKRKRKRKHAPGEEDK